MIPSQAYSLLQRGYISLGPMKVKPRSADAREFPPKASHGEDCTSVVNKVIEARRVLVYMRKL